MLPEGEVGGTHFLAALLGISEMVAGLTDREEVLGTIVRITPQLVGMDRCAILLYDEPRREFRTAVVHGPDRERNALYERLTITEAEARALAHRILEQKLPALGRESSFPRHIPGPLGTKMAPGGASPSPPRRKASSGGQRQRARARLSATRSE